MKKISFIIFGLLALMPVASASMVLDNIQFDPAVISAGDEVDIVVQFHDDSLFNDPRLGNPNYKFRVELQPDDALTENYVVMQDVFGDDLGGAVFQQGYYNKRFRVKVGQDAPAGNYEFKLTGRWYKDGEPVGAERFVRFKMLVKREGIILDVANINTMPSDVRPGDDYVKVSTFVENVGQKDSKSVEVKLDSPKMLEPSYANNNRLWAGRLDSGESKQIDFYLDASERAMPGVYQLNYTFNYMDVDDNRYTKTRSIPFRVQSRPYLEVVKTSGSALAGDSGELEVVVENTGHESSESVDVRVLKQSSQPFTIDVRSDYIGELEPGENGTAIFTLDAHRSADVKEHNFKLLIRSKGDSDEGDDNIYTYHRKASFDITGESRNPLLWIGLVAGALIVIVIVWRRKWKE